MPNTSKKRRKAAENDQPTAGSLLESLSEPACIINPDCRVLALNHHLSSWFDMAPEECHEQRLETLLSRNSRLVSLSGTLATILAQVNETGRSFRYEVSSGQLIAEVNPVCVQSGTISSLFIIFRDISVKTKPGHVFHAVREISSGLLDTIPCPAMIIDGSIRVVAWNRYAYDILFRGDHDPDPVDLSVFVEGDVMVLLAEKIHHVLSTGQDSRWEIPFMRIGDSCSIWLACGLKRIVIGAEACILLTGIDISDKKKGEKQLSAYQSSLSLALQATRAGLWEWEPENHKIDCSDDVWTLIGIEKKGRQPSIDLFSEALHPLDHEKISRALSEAAGNRSHIDVEFRVCHPDGAVRWMMSRARLVFGIDGKPERYIGVVIDITERKNTEIALLENKFRLDFALEATGAGIWEWDVRKDKVFWPERIWKLYGLEPDSIEPTHELFECGVHAEDRDLTIEAIISAANRHDTFCVEYRVCHADGSMHWLMCRGVPLDRSAVSSTHYLGMIMDITDRRRVEDEWRKSQEKLGFVIEKGNIGIWTVDLSDMTAQRTPQHARIFGYDSSAGEWSLARFLEHIVPEERQSIREKIEQSLKSHENHSFECKIQTADNRFRWIWVFSAFSYDSAGQRYCLTGIVQDITTRKQAELLLKESEEKFRDIFEFSPMAIGIADLKDGVLSDVNASWLRLFGSTKGEVIGRKISDLGLYSSYKDHEAVMHDLHEYGRVMNRQIEMKNVAGRQLTILFSAEAITITGQGYILLLMTDITVQELQQASISLLEKAVNERTDQLEEEVERLHRFLSMITHEYRTPLAIIRGNLDLIALKQKGGDYSFQREMDKIRRAIERLVEVMEVSIQESRILESQKVLTLSNFMLEPAILSQIEAFQAMWPERAIHYDGNLNGTEILGEQGPFKMAIFNLLDNARKFSPPESSIDLECHVVNTEVMIIIRNQGNSISGAESEELFEKYRRGSNAANTGGAGIGLWLVRDIIECLNGKVTLSGIESGVQATISLPCTRLAD
jgi:PAS domain S-box-containing protein